MNNKEQAIKKAIQAVLENAFNTVGRFKEKITLAKKPISAENIHILKAFVDADADGVYLFINDDLNFTPEVGDEVIHKGIKYRVKSVDTDQENAHFYIDALTIKGLK